MSLITLVAVGLLSARTTTVDLERLESPSSNHEIASAVRAAEIAYKSRYSWADVSPALQRLWQHGRSRFLVVSDGAVVAASDNALISMAAQETGGMLRLSHGMTTGAVTTLLLQEPGTPLRARGHVVGELYPVPAEPLPASRFAVVGEITRSMWISIALAAIAAVAAALILSAHILRPVEMISAAAGRLAGGDITARVDTTGSDEIAELGRSFNVMADRLAKLEQLRKDMVADIAHELRTPLTHIRGRVEAIQDAKLPADGTVMASLHADVVLLERLVHDLQDLSLADAGRLSLTTETVSVLEAVRSVTGSLSRVATLLPESLPNVLADRQRLRQIFQNLISNALAHVSDGGAVWVAARADGEVIVTVHNDGPTLDAPERLAIFERFRRLDGSRSRATGGFGLGLAIVKQLVESMGGRVWAENTSNPAGLSVLFTLPVSL